jgi:hypothetical protein
MTIAPDHLAPGLPAEALQRRLTEFNHTRFAPAVPSPDWRHSAQLELSLRQLEGEFVERERALVREQALLAPHNADDFVIWFEQLKDSGPGQGDRLFPWLAAHAELDAMRWFLQQEVAGEAGFEDLVAMTQVKMPTAAKLELARNYWDEMGQGHAGGMHGPMLTRLAKAMGLAPSADWIVWESLALGNMMVALAANRRYAYHSIGALGAIELTAPTRAVYVNAGLKRLGVGGVARRYFALHATLDVKHSAAWNREVIRPLVAEAPELRIPIAEGALLRLTAGARCFERYRSELGLDAS